MVEELITLIENSSGDYSKALSLLLVFMFFDFVTGVYCSYREGVKITSKRMREGLVEKFKWVIGIVFGLAIDYILDYSLVWSTIFVFASTVELFSIVENFKTMGFKGGGTDV